MEYYIVISFILSTRRRVIRPSLSWLSSRRRPLVPVGRVLVFFFFVGRLLWTRVRRFRGTSRPTSSYVSAAAAAAVVERMARRTRISFFPFYPPRAHTPQRTSTHVFLFSPFTIPVDFSPSYYCFFIFRAIRPSNPPLWEPVEKRSPNQPLSCRNVTPPPRGKRARRSRRVYSNFYVRARLCVCL